MSTPDIREILSGAGRSSDRDPAVDVLALIPRAIAEGGHVRVGLEDAPLGSERTNLQWVEEARTRIENAGGELATADEIRAWLNAVEMGD